MIGLFEPRLQASVASTPVPETVGRQQVRSPNSLAQTDPPTARVVNVEQTCGVFERENYPGGPVLHEREPAELISELGQTERFCRAADSQITPIPKER